MRFTTVVALALTALTASAMPIGTGTNALGPAQGAVDALTDKAKAPLSGVQNGETVPPARRTVPGEDSLKSSVDAAKKAAGAAAGGVHARDVPGLSEAERTAAKAAQAAKGHLAGVNARSATSGLSKAGEAVGVVKGAISKVTETTHDKGVSARTVGVPAAGDGTTGAAQGAVNGLKGTVSGLKGAANP